MVDTAHNILIRDVDIRSLAVVTLTVLVSEFWGAPEIITVLVVGMFWAFLSTPDSKEIVNSTIYKFENSVKPITDTKIWKKYGRPVSYIVIFTIITSLTVL